MFMFVSQLCGNPFVQRASCGVVFCELKPTEENINMELKIVNTCILKL